MTGCNTGPERLPKPLAATGAVIGHKTGSGDRNSTGALIGTNDIGFVQLPDGQHYTIAVFVKDSQESLQETERIIAEASDIVYRYMERTAALFTHGRQRSPDSISITPTGTASTTAAGGTPAAIGNQSIPGCPYHNEPGRRTCAAPVIRPIPELT